MKLVKCKTCVVLGQLDKLIVIQSVPWGDYNLIFLHTYFKFQMIFVSTSSVVNLDHLLLNPLKFE